MSQNLPFVTAGRSEDRLQNHPTIHDERHEEAQDAAQDHGRDLPVLDVHPPNTRLSTAKTVAARIVSGGCQWNAAGTMSPTVHTSSRIPRGHPGFPRQSAKGREVLAYLVEHEDLHDARRSVQERREDLQGP